MLVGFIKAPLTAFCFFRERGYIFSHTSMAITVWDALLMILIIYVAIYTPLVLVFEDQVVWRIYDTGINYHSFANVRARANKNV